MTFDTRFIALRLKTVPMHGLNWYVNMRTVPDPNEVIKGQLPKVFFYRENRLALQQLTQAFI